MSSSSHSGGAARMDIDIEVLKAAISGKATTIRDMVSQINPDVLRGTTPQGNTCLHIAAIHGHEEFCRDVVLALPGPSLLADVNADGETPLLTTITSGGHHQPLASVLLGLCLERQPDAILQKDKWGCNALHHAIRRGERKLALQLIDKVPELSRQVNKNNESPMFIAVMRDFTDVLDELLKIPGSSDEGAYDNNALHAAVRSGNSGSVKKILQKRPELAKGETKEKATPVYLAVRWGKTDILKVLLQHDPSLGYAASARGRVPALVSAGYQGHVGVARELLKHCPDVPYCKTNGTTCLHDAVSQGHMEFVKFVLGSKQLEKLVNMRDKDGKTPLHYAVQKCNPRMVATLLLHKSIDATMLSCEGLAATWHLGEVMDRAKTLNWNEVSMLMSRADPQNEPSIRNLHEEIKNHVTEKSRKKAKALTETYTSNTSLVAILIATITFAAAFTLPGGYSSDDGSQGFPIMARKLAFQAFLVSDTLAMCASLCVAFLCIIARWEDLEFLLYYRSITQKLMWFAYMATTTAFATGLYTVLAPTVLWLAVAVCLLPVLLPILTKLIGEWPVLKLRLQLGRTFKPELLDMV